MYENILSGIIGGLITSIFIPIVIYFSTRAFNKFRLKTTLIPSNEGKYTVFNLGISNHSLASLKNIYVHVTIDNEAKDIIQKTRFKTFTTD